MKRKRRRSYSGRSHPSGEEAAAFLDPILLLVDAIDRILGGVVFGGGDAVTHTGRL